MYFIYHEFFLYVSKNYKRDKLSIKHKMHRIFVPLWNKKIWNKAKAQDARRVKATQETQKLKAAEDRYDNKHKA